MMMNYSTNIPSSLVGQVRQVRQETSFGAREETHRPTQTFAYLLSRPATLTTSRAFSGRAGAHRGAQAAA